MLSIFSQEGYSQPARNDFRLNGGLSVALPIYNMDPVKVGTGIDLKGCYFFSEKIAATADAGVSLFIAADGIAPTFLVPVRLGLHYFINDQFFVFGKGGIGFYMLKTLETTSTRRFSNISGGVGYQFNPRFDLSVSYDGYSNKQGSFGYAQLRLGYNFVR